MRNPHTPKYMEIAESIRRLIAAGEFKPGDQLPPIREQAKSWHCTPGTVGRAYSLLTEENLVSGRHGGGTVVTESPLGSEPASLRLATLVNRAERFLLDALADGYAVGQVSTSVSMALSRWELIRARSAAPTGTSTRSNPLRFVGSHDLVIESLPAALAEGWALGPEPGVMGTPGTGNADQSAEGTRTRPRRSPVATALVLTYSGSLGGLMALARGEADLSGIHLWDAETDSYNIPFVRRVLPGRSAVLLTLFYRSLGLIVPPGNPQHIHSLTDLTRQEVSYVNRQQGSGTRVWLDVQLKSRDIDHRSVAGYTSERETHVDVARAVAQKHATVGLGIQSAAEAFRLDFVPLTQERYDLVFPSEVWGRTEIQQLVSYVRSTEFIRAVQRLGGYDLRETGKETWVG